MALKRWFTTVVPGNRNSAVSLSIKGHVSNVGFIPWLIRKARGAELDCLAIRSGKKNVTAVLIGDSNSIETFVQEVWKGPQRARVEKVAIRWFNDPVQKEYCQVKINFENELTWFKETEEILQRTFEHLKPIMKKPNDFNENSYLNNAGELARAAKIKGLFNARFSNINYLESPKKFLGFQQSQSSRVSTFTRDLTNNKQLTKNYLKKKKIPVPEGEIFTDLLLARGYLLSSAEHLVVKPLEGSYGKGITVGVKTIDELDVAWNYARKYHDQIILEKMFKGVDIRILVIGGIAKAALFRAPAHVIGDGINRIEELIDVKNRERMTNPRLSKAPIIPDDHVESFLRKQGYNYSSIPAKDKTIFLHFKANIGAGADSIIVTDYIHPDLMRLAEESASAFDNDDFWGVDMLVEKIECPRVEQKCVVIEVNSRANIFNVLYPMYGRPYDAAEALIEYLFPDQLCECSYPTINLRITTSGLFSSTFVKKVCKLADNFELQGHMQYSTNSAIIQAGGKYPNFMQFICELWGWDNLDNRNIDSLRITGFDIEIGKGFKATKIKPELKSILIDDKATYNFSEKEINSYKQSYFEYSEETDLNQNLYINAFRQLGYETKILYGDLIEIRKGRRSALTGMYFSSLFCDKLCEKLQPARILMSMKGIPVIRGMRFRPDDIKKALYYFEHLSSACILNLLFPDDVTTILIRDKKDFIIKWQSAVLKGCKHLIVEEIKKGWNVSMAVVDGSTVSTVIYKPIDLIGDGLSNISKLIEIKNSLRRQNPYYQNKPIITGSKIIDYLRLRSLNLNYVPAAGERILLEDTDRLELGGESVNYCEKIDESFKELAAKAVAVVSGLKFAVVHLVIPKPDQPAENQDWAVKKIDTKPTALPFHYPWIGKYGDLVDNVVAQLSLADDNINWIEEV